MAAGRVAEAIEMLHVPDRYHESQRWTVETLTTYIANYGSWDPSPDGTVWRITPIETAQGVKYVDPFGGDLVRYFDGGPSGTVELDLPLNGEWSDLTAHLEFQPVETGIGLSLYDLHVL
jgi:hypothetical protein